MVLMGELQAILHTDSETMHSILYRHGTEVRQRTYGSYLHHGKRVCMKTLHAISRKRLGKVKASLLENGLVPRVHGNTKRLPANTLSFTDTQRVVQFIVNYAEANAILLPGRIPGYKRSDFQLLQSSLSKRHLWHLYIAATESLTPPSRTVGYSTFCRFWKLFLPHILITKPMSDLCWVCMCGPFSGATVVPAQLDCGVLSSGGS